jgi:hypothetical protein
VRRWTARLAHAHAPLVYTGPAFMFTAAWAVYHPGPANRVLAAVLELVLVAYLITFGAWAAHPEPRCAVCTGAPHGHPEPWLRVYHWATRWPCAVIAVVFTVLCFLDAYFGTVVWMLNAVAFHARRMHRGYGDRCARCVRYRLLGCS